MKIYRWFFVGILFSVLAVSSSVLAQQRLIDSLKTTLNHQQHDTARANTYYDIANAFYKQGQDDSAGFYLKKTQQLCLLRNYMSGLGDYNRLKGVISMHQGLYEDALAFYQASITCYEKAGKPNAVAKIYHNMGLLYKLMGDSQHVLSYTRQGLTYIQRAITINQRLNAATLLAGNYINLGIIYEDLGEFKRGRDCFFNALAINENLAKPSPDDERISYNNLGKNYNVEGQYEQAIGFLNKSLTINLALKRTSSLAHNYRNLATAYKGLKQTDKALYYAEKALEMVKISKDAPLTNSVYGVLSETYAVAGLYEKAYASAVEYKRIADSLMNFEKTRAIAQLQGRYEVQQAHALAVIKANLELTKAREVTEIEARKEKEIAILQAKKTRRLAQIKAVAEIEKARAVAEVETRYGTQKRLQEIVALGQLNQQRSRQIQYMTGGLGVLVFLLSVLIAQYYMIRRANRRLAAQNEIITANSQQLLSQSSQLRTVMKELHHRVKNNLAIVSSLLNLQANGLHDEKAIQAVRVGQQRVEAMSLIHQRLYQTDQLTVVNMREYLTDLAESLMRAYGYQTDAFRLQIDIEKQELDVDVAIPLGLIVNELVTNAFKYAYNHQQYPSLRIGLHKNKDPHQSGITLEVQDNGPGIETADWRKTSNRASFGKRLITSLSEQLEGNFELLKENGTLFRLYIPKTRMAV